LPVGCVCDLTNANATIFVDGYDGVFVVMEVKVEPLFDNKSMRGDAVEANRR
jgi:hypothetical protein